MEIVIKEGAKYLLEMDENQFRTFCLSIGIAGGALCKQGLMDTAKKAFALQDSVREINNGSDEQG